MSIHIDIENCTIKFSNIETTPPLIHTVYHRHLNSILNNPSICLSSFSIIVYSAETECDEFAMLIDKITDEFYFQYSTWDSSLQDSWITLLDDFDSILRKIIKWHTS